MKPDHPNLTQIPALRCLWQEAFGDDDAFLDSFFSTAFRQDCCLCVADGAEILCAVYWLDAELEAGKGVYLYALATAKTHRGRGLAHDLLEQTHALLRQRGYVAAILVPGEGLQAFYSALGYRFFGGIRELTAAAQKPAAPLRKISASEYEALRKSYLPAGGVIQNNLEFLERCASLYAGEDFILAADGANGLELLGNAARAPHILEALGAKQGCFRTPGDTPFAMWLPLEACKAPTYFGLAFD